MQLTLDIPDDTYQHLAERAAALGTTIDALALDRLNERGRRDTSTAAPPANTQATTDADAWVATWRAWTGNMPTRAVTMDDRRDTIYGDDGR